MMRLLLGLLLVGNLLLFLYGYLGLDGGGKQRPQRLHEPDVGSIRLLAAKVSMAASREAPLAGKQAVQAEAELPEASEQPAPEDAAGPAESAVIATELAAPEEPGVTTDAETVASAAPEQEPVATPHAGEQESPAVSEQPAPAPEEVVTPVAAPQEPVTYCGTLGPFKSRIQAKRVRRKLGALQKIGIEQKPTLVDKSYWVLIPPLATRKEARAVVEKLKAAGVKDLWLVPKGDMRNAISLGLYSRKDAAYSHAENLRGKGFEVEVKPKQEEVSRYWLKFSGLDESAFGKLDPATLPQGVEMDKKVCGQASSVP